MPNRILHERICVSESIARLTADEERFFYRLLVQCDDYGRFDGRASVIRARCFALQLDSVSEQDIVAWISGLSERDLVSMYSVGGRPFLRVTTWERHQQTRAKRSKYPAPDAAARQSDSNGYHVPSDVTGIREARSEKREARSGGGCQHAAADASAGYAPAPTASTDTGHDQIFDVPAAVAGFHAVLVGTPGYEPSPALFDQITERYGSLDLRQQALKIRSWLADPAANRRQRSATTKFILGWFEREVSGAGLPTHHPNRPGPAPPKRATSWVGSFNGRHGAHSNRSTHPDGD